MPKVTFFESGDPRQVIDVAAGTNLIRSAVLAKVHGIEAEYSGCCSRAACHVGIGPAAHSLLRPIEALEDEMLSVIAAERRLARRLLAAGSGLTPEEAADPGFSLAVRLEAS